VGGRRVKAAKKRAVGMGQLMKHLRKVWRK